MYAFTFDYLTSICVCMCMYVGAHILRENELGTKRKTACVSEQSLQTKFCFFFPYVSCFVDFELGMGPEICVCVLNRQSQKYYIALRVFFFLDRFYFVLAYWPVRLFSLYESAFTSCCLAYIKMW